MSLVEAIGCPVCRQTISREAIRCKGCGALLSEGLSAGKMTFRGKVLLVTAIIISATLAIAATNLARTHDGTMAGSQTGAR